jgi:hypothetical protein
MKECKKHCKIGEMEFDIIITRDLVFETMKKYPKYWEIVEKNKQIKSEEIDMSKLEDLEKLMELNDELAELSPKMVAYSLPRMLKLANDKTNADEIIQYCVDNDADEVFYTKTMEFFMLGFTKGNAVKKPKIEIVM